MNDQVMIIAKDSVHLAVMDDDSDEKWLDGSVLECVLCFLGRGEARGELKGSIRNILAILRNKFQYVPEEFVIELNKRTDATALESLGILAAQCKTLDEFSDGLK